ncbi:gliding motility-associated-like protein [Arcticibacter pallidicorallinus]|uniref:Gliding motility-associated-like protein n=1 Tax=Arcticibacter pallidicorallinus TaxID=1259464 RepID=A0A2T0TT81_9SPHI|nr:gliding motility-associated C-terminal domain-containing protein [Arcticibacter pallidicorallinus]PRY48904.1 gliding motility-associated-like protein [Arcticibacter pallidicorallinus]
MAQITTSDIGNIKNTIIGLLLSFLLLPSTGQAQISIGAEGLTVKQNTLFSLEGLALVPSIELTLRSVSLTRDSAPVQWPQFSGIKRVYRFSSPIAFQGALNMSFMDSELNGNAAKDLVLAYTSLSTSSDYLNYSLSTSSLVNTSTKLISHDFEQIASLSGLTAVTPGSLVVPVTPANATICEGSSVTLSTIPGASWQWFRNGVLIPGGTGPSLVASGSGNYTVRVVFQSGLAVVSEPAEVVVNTSLVGNLSSARTTISLGETTTLKASGGIAYFWEEADGIISGSHTDSLVVRPSKNATYKVVISNGSGCNVVKTIDIEVKDDYKTLIANNIVTPNGDGVNDVWIVQNLDLYPNNEVVIFDRAGRVVFRQFDYKNTWDGTHNGVALPEDTYYYALYINSGKGKLTGFITIVRD